MHPYAAASDLNWRGLSIDWPSEKYRPIVRPMVSPVHSLVLLVALAVGHSFGASGEKGSVATVHSIASEAGVRAFERGGNAVDAAVAAALTLGVVDGHNSGIGGGCFMLIRTATGKFISLDGREKAPAAASRNMFVRDGHAEPALSQTGALAV